MGTEHSSRVAGRRLVLNSDAEGMTMGLLNFLGRRNRSADSRRLVGLWTAPGIEMQFMDDGMMNYIVVEPDKRLIAKLTYRIDGSVIISNQPSAPREERTLFSFEGEQLVLMFGGKRTAYTRAAP